MAVYYIFCYSSDKIFVNNLITNDNLNSACFTTVLVLRLRNKVLLYEFTVLCL